jgi:branched-chain amino acid transport system permease protein
MSALSRSRVWNAGGVWIVFAAVLLVMPQLFSSNFGLTILCQIGIVIVSCVSFHLLLGEGGMLSFGHAVYTGMGGYFAIHALNAWGKGEHYIPVSLLPLVGGLGSLCLAFFLGFVSTRQSGTTFAMITLGTSELIASMALMFSDFFGGEAGLTANRVTGHAVLGITFGPQIEVYYLIAVYCFECVLLMYLFTKTPLGIMLNAVRDNPMRVGFIGYNTLRIRWFAFMISGFFAGVAGGLAALNFELVNSEVVGPVRSGAYILFTFLGGIKAFFGPIIGAVLLVLTNNVFSSLTKAWLLYLGLIFYISVMYLPGGLASVVVRHLEAVKTMARLQGIGGGAGGAAQTAFGKIVKSYLLLLLTLLPLMAGVSLIIEMLYQLQLGDSISSDFYFAGDAVDPQNPWVWILGLIFSGLCTLLFNRARLYTQQAWSDFDEIVKSHQSALEVLQEAWDGVQHKAEDEFVPEFVHESADKSTHQPTHQPTINGGQS